MATQQASAPQVLSRERLALQTARPKTRIVFICVAIALTGVVQGFWHGWNTRALALRWCPVFTKSDSTGTPPRAMFGYPDVPSGYPRCHHRAGIARIFAAPLTPGRTSMAKVPAYHTNSVEYPPHHRNVHHDHDECPDGKRIKPEHREKGIGNKPRCKECIKLG